MRTGALLTERELRAPFQRGQKEGWVRNILTRIREED